jgi:hypothetical protein
MLVMTLWHSVDQVPRNNSPHYIDSKLEHFLLKSKYNICRVRNSARKEKCIGIARYYFLSSHQIRPHKIILKHELECVRQTTTLALLQQILDLHGSIQAG